MKENTDPKFLDKVNACINEVFKENTVRLQKIEMNLEETTYFVNNEIKTYGQFTSFIRPYASKHGITSSNVRTSSGRLTQTINILHSTLFQAEMNNFLKARNEQMKKEGNG